MNAIHPPASFRFIIERIIMISAPVALVCLSDWKRRLEVACSARPAPEMALASPGPESAPTAAVGAAPSSGVIQIQSDWLSIDPWIFLSSFGMDR